MLAPWNTCARRHALHQRVDRGQHDARRGGRLQQARQRGDALADQFRVGRDAVVGQAVPGGKAQHARVCGAKKASASAIRAMRRRRGRRAAAGRGARAARRASRTASHPSGAPQTGTAVIARPPMFIESARMARSIGAASCGSGRAAGQPVGQVGVGQVQQRLQRVHLGIGEPVDPACDIAADQQVGLLRAAMGGAEQQHGAGARRAAGQGSRASRLSYSPASASVSAVQHDPTRPAFRTPDQPARRRRAARAAGGPRRGRGAGDRPAVPPARVAISTAASARRCAAAPPGRVVTVAVEVVRIEQPANARQPTRAVVTRRQRLRRDRFLQALPRTPRLPVGARVLVSGKADERRQLRPSRPHRAGGQAADRLPDDRAGLAADRRPVPLAPARPDRRRRSPACPSCRNGTTRRCCGARTGPVSPRRCARCTPPRHRPRPRRGGGSPMTSCWPGRWRWRWCAGGCARGPAGR